MNPILHTPFIRITNFTFNFEESTLALSLEWGANYKVWFYPSRKNHHQAPGHEKLLKIQSDLIRM